MTTSTLKKHLNLRLIFYAISTCFTIITMFYPISCKKQKEATSQESVEILRKEQEFLKQSVQAKVQILNRRADTLQSQLRLVNRKLAGRKSEHLIKRTSIKNMLQPDEKNALKAPCDTIKEAVLDYIKSDEQQDSVYESAIETLNAVVDIKDSCIGELQIALGKSLDLVDRSLTHQVQLEKVIASTKRELQQKQIINRVLGASALILAGTTAILILR